MLWVVNKISNRSLCNSITHNSKRFKEKIDQKSVEQIEKIKGSFFNSGQYQIIFGTGTVNKIFEEVINLGISSQTKSDQAQLAGKDKNFSILKPK